MQIHLLVIDPQNDFCDPAGNLAVPGANEDMERLAKMIAKMGNRLDDIHVTLDSHLPLHIAHPIMWMDSQGNNPPPFTLISKDDVVNGVWRMSKPMQKQGVPYDMHYVEELEKNGRYVLCIWPPHCLIGTLGHAIIPVLSDQLVEWQNSNLAYARYVSKGSNILTEHYSAIRADVEDPGDPTTQLNMEMINILQDPEIQDILISGEASSHCVYNTIQDIADNFGEDNIKKFVFLEDASSAVPGFEPLALEFVSKMTARGMRISTTTDYA